MVTEGGKIDELQIEIQASAKQASSGAEALVASLTTLKGAVKGGAGLTATTNQLKKLSDAVSKMTDPTGKIRSLVDGLKPLGEIGKSNLGSALNQLKKIPEITAGLDDAKLSAVPAAKKNRTGNKRCASACRRNGEGICRV